MTPKERAEKVFAEWDDIQGSTTRSFVDVVADTIRAAVAEERERCAKIVAEHARRVAAISGTLGPDSSHHEHREMVGRVLRLVEEAILEGGKP